MRRHPRHPLRQLPRDLWPYRERGSSTPSTRTCPSTDLRGRGRLAGDLLPNKTLEQQIASGLHADATSRRTRAGAIDEEYQRPLTPATASRPSRRCSWARRPKPRPSATITSSTRSARRSSTSSRPSSTTRPRPRWTATSRTRPRRSSSPSVADRLRWAGALRRSAAATRAATSRPARRPPALEFDKFLAGSAAFDSVAEMIPTEGQTLQFAPRLGDVTKPPKPRPRAGAGAGRGGRLRAGQGLLLRRLGPPEQGRPLGRPARPDGRQARLPRLGPLARGPTRSVTHIINNWPDDAAQDLSRRTRSSPGSGPHVFVTYDGSSKAGGIKVYRRRSPPSLIRRWRPTHLKSTIRTQVPFKVGQRHSTSRTFDDVLIHDVRTYSRTLSPEEVRMLVGSSRTYDLVAKPAKDRPSAEVDATFLWWLGSSYKPSKDLLARLIQAGGRGGRDQGAGDDRPRHEREVGAADGLHPQPRRLRQAQGRREGRHARLPAADALRPPAEPARPGPVAPPPRAPADGPRDREPLLAGAVRHRPRADGRRLRRHRGAAEPPRAARLARRRVPRRSRVGQLKKLYATKSDGDVGGLSPVGRGDEGEDREGPRQPTRLARAEVPHGRRDGRAENYATSASSGQLLHVGEDRRAERPAVPAGGGLGGRRHAREQHAELQA